MRDSAKANYHQRQIAHQAGEGAESTSSKTTMLGIDKARNNAYESVYVGH